MSSIHIIPAYSRYETVSPAVCVRFQEHVYGISSVPLYVFLMQSSGKPFGRRREVLVQLVSSHHRGLPVPLCLVTPCFIIVLLLFTVSISSPLGLVLLLVVHEHPCLCPRRCLLRPPPDSPLILDRGAHMRYVPSQFVSFPVSQFASSTSANMSIAVIRVEIVRPVWSANALNALHGVATFLPSGYMNLVPALILPVSSPFAAIPTLVVPDVVSPDAVGLLQAGTGHFVPQTAAVSAAGAVFLLRDTPALAVASATHDVTLERVMRIADAVDLLCSVPGFLGTDTLRAPWTLSLSVFPALVVRTLGVRSSNDDIAAYLVFVVHDIIVPGVASIAATSTLRGIPAYLLPGTTAVIAEWPVFLSVFLPPVVQALGDHSATIDIAADLIFCLPALFVAIAIVTGPIHVAYAVSHVFIYHWVPSVIHDPMDIDDPDHPMADDTNHYIVDSTEDNMDVDI